MANTRKITATFVTNTAGHEDFDFRKKTRQPKKLIDLFSAPLKYFWNKTQRFPSNTERFRIVGENKINTPGIFCTLGTKRCATTCYQVLTLFTCKCIPEKKNMYTYLNLRYPTQKRVTTVLVKYTVSALNLHISLYIKCTHMEVNNWSVYPSTLKLMLSHRGWEHLRPFCLKQSSWQRKSDNPEQERTYSQGKENSKRNSEFALDHLNWYQEGALRCPAFLQAGNKVKSHLGIFEKFRAELDQDFLI